MSIRELYPNYDRDIRILAARGVIADQVLAGSLKVDPRTGTISFRNVGPGQRTYLDVMRMAAAESVELRRLGVESSAT